MDPTPDYDPSLSDQIRTELSAASGGAGESRPGLGAVIGRLESDLGHPLSDSGRRERILAFLHGAPSDRPPPSGSPPADRGPVTRALQEMSSMSLRLDSAPGGPDGFSVAVGVARRAHELAWLVDGAISALDPKDAIAAAFHRLAALLSRLIGNAVAKLREFAKRLGVSSFSLAFASDPPCVTATFTFGGG